MFPQRGGIGHTGRQSQFGPPFLRDAAVLARALQMQEFGQNSANGHVGILRWAASTFQPRTRLLTLLSFREQSGPVQYRERHIANTFVQTDHARLQWGRIVQHSKGFGWDRRVDPRSTGVHASIRSRRRFDGWINSNDCFFLKFSAIYSPLSYFCGCNWIFVRCVWLARVESTKDEFSLSSTSTLTQDFMLSALIVASRARMRGLLSRNYFHFPKVFFSKEQIYVIVCVPRMERVVFFLFLCRKTRGPAEHS